MVQISLESGRVGFREVGEEIGSIRVEVPAGESGALERMLFIHPDAPPFLLLNTKE
jgi:hypothetical protein